MAPETAVVHAAVAAGVGDEPPAGGAPAPASLAARQGSQKTAEPTTRVHSWQRGLPQFWQKAARSRSGWFAQFIPIPLLA